MQAARGRGGAWLWAGLAIWVGLSSAAVASAREWDQASAARLADEFQQAIEALLQDPSIAPEQDTAMQDRRHAAALANVKNIERLARQLAGMLRDGLGRDATSTHVDRIAEILDSVGELARGSTVGETAQARAQNVRSLYRRLREFYD